MHESLNEKHSNSAESCWSYLKRFRPLWIYKLDISVTLDWSVGMQHCLSLNHKRPVDSDTRFLLISSCVVLPDPSQEAPDTPPLMETKCCYESSSALDFASSLYYMMIAIIRHAVGSLHAYLKVSQQWRYSEKVSCVFIWWREMVIIFLIRMILLMNNIIIMIFELFGFLNNRNDIQVSVQNPPNAAGRPRKGENSHI